MNFIDIAFCKAQIIIFGIDYQTSLFNDCDEFKTKKKYIRPVINNREVFDSSTIYELIPSEIIIEVNGCQSLVKTRHNPQSPIKGERKGDLIKLLFTNESFECKGKLVRKNKVLEEKLLIKQLEFKVKDFLSIVGQDRISILLFDGCCNWNIGIPCKFCDMHPRAKSEKVFIPSVNELYGYNLDIQNWWNENNDIFLDGIHEAYKRVISSDEFGPHYHNFLMAGSLPDAFFTWNFAIELLMKINKDIIGETIVNLQPHSSKNQLFELKKYGVSKVQYNIEVFGEEIYQSTCPDKIPYNTLLKKLEEAVEVFGPGNVRSNFVLGLQPIEEVYNGMNMLSKIGVVPDYSIFQPKRNTAYENHEMATLQDVINCSKYLCDLYLKYNYRPIFCNMSSRSSIMNEMYSAYEKNN